MSAIAKWVTVAWLAFSIVASIASIGKPKGQSNGAAILATIIHGLLIAGICVWWQT